MTALEFIKLKQKSWAERKKGKDFELRPGTIANEDGDKIYFEKIDDNIYEKLSPKNKAFFEKGQGNETDDNCIRRAKMKSAVSSSAIAVNLFQYWQEKENISPLLKALRIIRKNNRTTTNATIKFEDKKEIINPETISTPNLDITIESKNLQHIIAIESKFTEPYSSKTQKELSEKYNNEKLWVGLKNIKEEIYNLEDEKRKKIFKFKRLDYLQLIKHILGLKTQHGKKFTLLYLWYDVPGTKGYEHRQEIEQFAKIVKNDGIDFHHITYQEVIFNLKENYYDEHKDYIDYLVERYL